MLARCVLILIVRDQNHSATAPRLEYLHKCVKASGIFGCHADTLTLVMQYHARLYWRASLPG
jgi:hypothetical protein